MATVSTNTQKSKSARYERTSGSHSRDNPSILYVTKLTFSLIRARPESYILSLLVVKCSRCSFLTLGHLACVVFLPATACLCQSKSAVSSHLLSRLSCFSAALQAHRFLSHAHRVVRVPRALLHQTVVLTAFLGQ